MNADASDPPRASAPRLLLINYEYPPLGGGAANATQNLARELARLGAVVRVVTSSFAGLPRFETTTDGVEIVRIPTVRRQRDRSSIAEMLCFLASSLVMVPLNARRWRADVSIAFFGIPSGPSAWLTKALLGIPYVVSLRGGDVPGFQYDGIGLYHRLAGPVIGFLWRRARSVVANSEGLADLARRFAPDVAIALVPNGVDADLFSPPAVPRPQDGPPKLLVVGRLVRQKGVDCILRAMAETPIAATLRVVGDGDARAELEAQAQALGLAARVRFEGWVDRAALPDIYRAADVFVLPSRDEGMPNVVLEAMAAGLAVVGTDIPGNRDLIVPGDTGLLVPVDDVRALGAALGRLETDPVLRHEMGAAGRRRVVETFSWRSAAARYLALGRPALAREPGRIVQKPDG